MGPIMERSIMQLPLGLVGQDGDGVILEREAEDGTVWLERFGNDMRLAHSSTFVPTKDGKGMQPWYVTEFADHYLVLARDKPEGQDSAWFHLGRLSPATLEPTAWSPLSAVDTKGRKITFTMERCGFKNYMVLGSKERGTEVQCSSTQSPNERSILFYTDYAMAKDEPDAYDVVVLDDQLKKRWSACLQFPHAEEQFELWEASVDDEGNAYLQGCLYFDGDEVAVKGKPNFEHRLLRVGSDGIAWDAAITLGERFIKSCFTYAQGADLFVAGFYAEDKSMEARGFYLQRIDPATGTIAERHEVPFDRSVFTAMLGERKGAAQYGKFADNKAQGIEAMKMRSFTRLDDGRLRIVGEVARTEWVTRTTTNPHMGHGRLKYKDQNTYPVYHRGGMFIWTLANDRSVQRVDVVKKEQAVPLWELLAGYDRFVPDGGDDQYILFNDDPANLDPERLAGEKGTAKWNGGKGCVTLVRLSPNGEQHRSALFDIKDDEAALYVGLSIKRTPQETWFFSKFKEQERWVRMMHE